MESLNADRGHGRLNTKTTKTMKTVGTGARVQGRRRRAQGEAVAAAGRLRRIYEAMAGGVIVADGAGRIVEVNAAAEDIMGVARQQLRGLHLTDVPWSSRWPDDRPMAVEDRPSIVALSGRRGVRAVVLRVVRPDGAHRWLQVDAVPIIADDGTVEHIVISYIDLTERRAAEESLRRERDFSSAVVETARNPIMVLDHTGRVVRFNEACERISGYAEDEARGHTFWDLFVPADERDTVRAIFALLLAGQTIEPLETHWRRRDGSLRLVAWSYATLAGDDGAPRYAIATGIDMTDRARAEQALRRQALHDALTGLPNRTLLLDRAEQAFLSAQADGTPLALLLLDLDRFAEINDTLGHHHGDALLRQIAPRLRAALRATDTVARLGGDEFAVLLPDGDSPRAAATARGLLAVLEDPFIVDGRTLRVGAGIGIALCPDHSADVGMLLRHADVAMYVAKATHSGYAFYDAARDEHSPDRLALTADLRRAIERDELRLHYQPVVDLISGHVRGVEALVRWEHPERGLLPPDAFIYIAERTGLVIPLTHWVLHTAVEQCRDWQRQWPHLGLSVAVNLSMWSLLDPHLPDTIAALLRSHGVAPRSLRIELTETTMMTDARRSLDVLSRLSALGVRISVDDFGTGHSSLTYLKNLPIDELKIDKSFVTHMATNEADAAIVRSTVDLGHSLGLRVVAEGVMDDATWERLVALQCDNAQGYFLSPPLPAAGLDEWLVASG